MPAPRSCFQLAAVGSRMYAVGGDEDSTVMSIDSEYNDTEWSDEFPYIPPLLQYTTCVALKKHIYLFVWRLGQHDGGRFGRLTPKDGSGWFARLPLGARFRKARLVVVKTRPCEAERPRNDV